MTCIASSAALVTGAASGLGRCFARELLAAGAQVAACDLEMRGLRELSTEAGDAASRLFIARVDIADAAAVDAFVNEAYATFGGLHIAINNAGVLRDGLLVKPVDGTFMMQPLRQWSRVLDVNLTGQFHVARAVAHKMLEHGVRDGVIVNVSSLARSGNVGQGSYAASKAGLDAAMRSWALELAPAGIRVASVAPGVIDTPMLGEISEDALEHLKRTVPLGRIGRPEEVWLAVRFAVECDFFTGRTVEVDGGAIMGAA